MRSNSNKKRITNHKTAWLNKGIRGLHRPPPPQPVHLVIAAADVVEIVNGVRLKKGSSNEEPCDCSIPHRHQILRYGKRSGFGLIRAAIPRRNKPLILVLPRFPMVNPFCDAIKSCPKTTSNPRLAISPTLIKEEFTPTPIPLHQLHLFHFLNFRINSAQIFTEPV